MRLRLLPLVVSAVVSLAVPAQASTNALLVPSTLPFGAPQFDKIHDADYLPAFREGMARQRREIDAIVNNAAKPTFENTVVAMERSGQTLTRVSAIFFNVQQANTNDAMDKVQETVAPELAAHNDAIYLNPKLFARVKYVHDHPPAGLDPESKRLLAVTYQQFILAGAGLKAADATKLKALNQRISVLQTAFQQKLIAGTAKGALVVDSADALAGLTPDEITAAAEAAKARHMDGKWVIPLQNTTQQPAQRELTNRATRQKLFEQSTMRTQRGDANDTRATIAELAMLRAQKAALLGYPNFSSYALVDQMAKTPQHVQSFLHGLISANGPAAKNEAAELQALLDKDVPGATLQPWDWQFYAEKLRKQKYDINEQEVRPYFELDNVLKNGLFYAAHQLYGITLTERHDLPVYNPDVRAFTVTDSNGKDIGIMYFDFFKRDNKSGGAWMSNFVGQSTLLGTKPVIYNVLNIPKPPTGQPVLLNAENVVGIFHEFGHALNGFFANTKYPSLSGASTARDFVEYPSQFNEHWAFYPDVLKHYAFHYQTKQPIPQALLDKLQAASKFNQPFSLGELLAADELDLSWHSLPGTTNLEDVDAFETQALKTTGTNFDAIPPRYRTSYFAHIWGGGYASGYYAYMWTKMLADDSYAWFTAHGGMTRANGDRFRRMILSRGQTEDYATMFRAFYGKDPDVAPMLDGFGLK